MAKYMVAFMSSGGMTVEAENEDEARKVFEQANKLLSPRNEVTGTNCSYALITKGQGCCLLICPLICPRIFILFSGR